MRNHSRVTANEIDKLGGLGLRTVRDEAAGIQVELPMGVLGEPATEPPFVRYDGREGVPPQVLLISQPGDQGRLWGLYEIMQTLEIVPPEGPRERTEDAFVIEGQDGRIHSTTYAWLVEGQIKGFTLVWPAGDEDRRARLVEAMRASFRQLPGEALARALGLQPQGEEDHERGHGEEIRDEAPLARGALLPPGSEARHRVTSRPLAYSTAFTGRPS